MLGAIIAGAELTNAVVVCLLCSTIGAFLLGGTAAFFAGVMEPAESFDIQGLVYLSKLDELPLGPKVTADNAGQ